MVRIVLLTTFLIVIAAVTAPVVKCQSAFEICPVVDSLQHGAIRIFDEGSHGDVFVSGRALFSIPDVDSARVYLGKEADGTPLYGVNIDLKPSLNDSMRNLTGRLVGHRLAFVVDGKILATPKILDPIQTARVGLFTKTEVEARALAKKINQAIEAQRVSVAPAGTQESEKAAMDSVQQFLLTEAASDFHAHGPSHVIRFRDVHFRYLTSQTGEKRYILCGQFLPENQEGTAKWIAFVTIKTDPYEQWIGGSAAAYCQESSQVPSVAGDLSSSLQALFDSLR